jgi:hypothetical protein
MATVKVLDAYAILAFLGDEPSADQEGDVMIAWL